MLVIIMITNGFFKWLHQLFCSQLCYFLLSSNNNCKFLYRFLQSAVGFEIWSMSSDILFDNIIITEEIAIADKWAADTFDKKRQKISKDSVSLVIL